MFHFAYIVGPLMGGVIGYITNALAIRMLFRPYEAKYLFGWKLPFTPGIIPKEKGRIATSIGGAISENLMSKEVLEKNLLSDDMIAKIRGAVNDYAYTQLHNPETLREYLLNFLSENELDTAIGNVKGDLSRQVASRLGDTALGDKIAEAVVEHVSSKLKIDGLEGIKMPGIISSLLGGSLWSALAKAISVPLKNYLSRNINSMLGEKGPEIVGNLLDTETEKLFSTPVQQLLSGREEQVKQFCDTVVSLYRRLISEQLPKILATVDIPRIIEGRINEMDMRETEKLIFQVMDKELKAIIWLGAFLGLLMGTVNAFI